MLAGSRLADAQFGVLSAPPMDDQDDLARRLVDIDDDLVDQGAHQLLAAAHGDAGCFQAASRSSAKPVKSGGAMDGCWRRQPLKSRLAVLDAAQRRLPVLLQLRGDQSVVGIAGGIAAFGERRLIARLLELELDDALLFGLAFHVPPFRLLRRLDRHRLDGADQLAGDRRIDAQAAEHHTTRQPSIRLGRSHR